VFHHISIRGIERRNIFKDDRDRENLLQRMKTLLPETATACYAWALLSNHAHFLFRTGKVPLATLMRRLLTGYVVSFNRRHKCHGHLLQNRYWAVRELGISLTDLPMRLKMSPPGLGYAVKRGEAIAHDNGYQLTGWVS
jgi:REP element-mobilizing transposase RayT